MTANTALRAALGIALLTAMDAVIKAQMQQHPFLLALFMRFAAGAVCAIIVVTVLRPARPMQPARPTLLAPARPSSSPQTTRRSNCG